jgi:hypothetical protein
MENLVPAGSQQPRQRATRLFADSAASSDASTPPVVARQQCVPVALHKPCHNSSVAALRSTRAQASPLMTGHAPCIDLFSNKPLALMLWKRMAAESHAGRRATRSSSGSSSVDDCTPAPLDTRRHRSEGKAVLDSL